MSTGTSAATRPAAGDAGRRVQVVAPRLLVSGQVVLRDVEVEVRAGEAVGVAGPNGAGKSTLLRALAGLDGEPSVERNLDLDSADGAIDGVVLVGHDPGLHPHLTLAENLRLVAALRSGAALPVAMALERVGLAGAAGRLAGRCSEGMLRRAGLARAWASRPALLLLDEPTAGLDAASRGLPAALVRSTTAAGGMVVVATHEPVAFDGVIDRWLHVSGGRVTSRLP
ncbi:ABC transporter ATP-binding protein [Nitriliruptoraceae bacterium ZYF776]|nr:ABC transporter ATP-binding protein [Profundirhabdus halotolerans]